MAANEEMLDALISGFHSDREALFRALIAQLDESMLLEIARADYGDDQESHEHALRAICSSGRVDAMSWHPGEVLQLIRWSHPENPEWGPGGHGERGHVMRAFCCSSLLQVNDYGGGGENQSVAPLIESALSLGGSLPTLTRSFLVWCLREADVEREERPFFVLGLIILAAAAGEDAPGHGEIIRMIHWIDLEDAAIRNDEYGPIDQRALWGLTPFDLSHAIWLRLVQTHLASNERLELREFGERLVTEHSRERRPKR